MKTPSLRDLVDAELPLTEAQLGEIWRNTQRRNRLSMKEAIVFFSMYFGPPILMLVFGGLLINATGYRKSGSALIGLFMCAWFLVAVTLLSKRPWYAIPFRRELQRRGYEVCVACGYWLRGLPQETKRCPECGKLITRKSVEAS